MWAAVIATSVVSITSGAAGGLALEPLLPRPGARPSDESRAEAGAGGDDLRLDDEVELDERADRATGTWSEEPRPISNELVAAEIAAERFAGAGNERARIARAAAGRASHASLPVPEAPREAGLLGELTDVRLAGEDRDAFYLAAAANRRAEAGTGAARYSTLRTTAGAEHRASFGVAQLTIRDHLFHASRLDDVQLAEVGVDRSEIELMQRRGEAASAWYHVLVDQRDAASAQRRAGLSASDAESARRLATAGDRAALIARFGRRFASSTGLGEAAIAEVADTVSLRRRDVREAFAARYRRDHGTAFDPTSRDMSRMCASARAIARERRELARLIDRFGGGDAGAASLAHYLGVGDVAENLYGWYARAASAAVGARRYDALLLALDPLSTRMRELSNFESAIAAVRAVRDLAGVERARMLTRLARCFHGAPGRARDAFFFDDDLARPRATRAAELEAAIQEYRLARRWSDERVQRAFDELAHERGLM